MIPSLCRGRGGIPASAPTRTPNACRGGQAARRRAARGSSTTGVWAARRPTLDSSPNSELGDLVERQLDRGLALEEGDEHGELAALRLDLADRAGEARERALLDRDGLAHLEVDLGRDDARRGLAAALASRAALAGRLDHLHEALEHVEGLFEAQRRRIV